MRRAAIVWAPRYIFHFREFTFECEMGKVLTKAKGIWNMMPSPWADPSEYREIHVRMLRVCGFYLENVPDRKLIPQSATWGNVNRSWRESRVESSLFWPRQMEFAAKNNYGWGKRESNTVNSQIRNRPPLKLADYGCPRRLKAHNRKTANLCKTWKWMQVNCSGK